MTFISRFSVRFWSFAVLCVCSLYSAISAVVDYDIVYVRNPRDGDYVRFDFPEVFHPLAVYPGTDLMLLHPDGSEEVLVEGGKGGVVDPYVSFDGLWVYYSKFHDQTEEARGTRQLSKAGADIFKINVQTREVVQLTHQEWTPNTGVIDWSESPVERDDQDAGSLGYGIFNLSPCPLPGGRLMFTSSRNGFAPNKTYTTLNLQLYVMDNDGSNVEFIGHLNLGSALHPTVLMDGRVMFSSYEAQGLRDQRIWGLWAIDPDGRDWGPLMSGLNAPKVMHFQTQLSNGDITVVEYYNLNNNGFGTLLAFPPKASPEMPPFGSPVASDVSNPEIPAGIWWFNDDHPAHKLPVYERYSFSPQGLYSLTPFAHGRDNASSRNQSGEYAGKVTHPSGAPGNDVLLVWTPGPANNLNRPTNVPVVDAGIYILDKGIPESDESKLVLIKNDPNYNEMQPRAVVSYEAIYGIREPVNRPWYKNDGEEHVALEAGTPFGLVGSSSFYKRDTTPGKGSEKFDGLDPFNTSQNGVSTNWTSQGADAGKYDNSDIYAVRVIAMEPTSMGASRLQTKGFRNHANERLRILGEIPLRKFDDNGEAILDSEGNPDTSFLVKIPADMPYTFQTIDKDGLALNISQTWHQSRPGEVRVDCGGCHAHSQQPLKFEGTAASKADYDITDLLGFTPILSKDDAGEVVVKKVQAGAVDVEYYRDIKPILERSCGKCHSLDGRQEAGLVLDDETQKYGYDMTYNRLADDSSAEFGRAPVIKNGTWRQTNASRYIRKFQSRRSLLVWKVFGRRLDGWLNEDHPTESVPGDASTLPEGVNPDDADIDFVGTIMPPPDSGIPALSEDEKMMFARWVDLGCPISSPDENKQAFGWFADELRPTLDVSLPSKARYVESLDHIRLGAYDYYSGLDKASLSVVANFDVDGHPAGAELSSLFSEIGEYVWAYDLESPIDVLRDGVLTVRVKDMSGNWNEVERRFSTFSGMGEASISGVWADDAGAVHLFVEGENATQLEIEKSGDLESWSPFVDLLDFDGRQTVLDTESGERRFYRLRAKESVEGE